MTDPLPKFKNPPVFETVLGVQFKPLSGWSIPHVGIYHSRVKTLYPIVQVHPPLPDELESFEPAKPSREVRLHLGPNSNRSWYITKNGEWLLQIQQSKFLSNWRKQESSSYPDFKGFLDHFDREWTRFKTFLGKENIEGPQIEQVEVTYFNHIEGAKSWGKAFPILEPGFQGKFLGSPEGVSIQGVFPIEGGKGRLYIVAEPVIRHSDLQEVIQLSLTSKVLVAKGDNIFDSLKLAHKWVVKGFADFTSSEMHKAWGRTR